MVIPAVSRKERYEKTAKNAELAATGKNIEKLRPTKNFIKAYLMQLNESLKCLMLKSVAVFHS